MKNRLPASLLPSPLTAAFTASLTAAMVMGLGVGSGGPSVQARSAIDTSRAGVVCDAAEQLCFNREGISLSETRRSFGLNGEEKARRLIARGERGRTFLLSNGVACDVMARTCWDDGWKRRNVANSLTRHLFGSGGANWTGSGGSYSADCLLRRAGRVIYNGNCELRESSGDRADRFSATLSNGARYSFRNEGGRWWIGDSSGGRWPVSHYDYGRAAVFRWADMSLETRQRNYRGNNSRNRSIEDVLRELFN